VESRLPGRIKKIEEKEKKQNREPSPVLCFLFGVNFKAALKPGMKKA